MSSEDDYYYDRYDYRFDRRSSKRPRRRASSPQRHRHLGSDYSHRKGRRNKAVYNPFGPRIAGLIILLLLIIYEVFVFKGAASSKSTSPNQSETSNTRQNSVPSSFPVGVDVEPQSHRKTPSPLSPPSSNFSSSSFAGTDSQSSTLSSRNPSPSISVAAEAASSSSTVDAVKPKTSDNNPLSAEQKTKALRLPESAIKLEKRGADEDPETETGAVSKRASSQTSADSSLSSDQNDISKTTPSRDKGAEPGAGENFWKWFQETKGGDEKGTSKSLPCPEESKRLCQMFYKYLRKYKIRRIFDVSCEKNFEWMGGILKKAGNELWGFKYYCSLWNGQRAGDARKRLQGLPFVEFKEEMWWKDGFAPDTELLFAWDTLPHLAYGRVWNFFVKARKQDIKYILVDNYPGILNDPSPKHDFLNLRKHPFRFPSAKEVAQNVTEPGETAKRQLLFYETSMLPDNLQ